MDESKRLRALLDERGIEYVIRVPWNDTAWEHDGTHFTAVERFGKLYMQTSQGPMTPEQTIAATVGVGTCTIVKTWTDSDYADHWRYSCSECGYQIEVGERDIATGNPTSHANFCWNCGRRCIGIKEVTE